MKRTLNPILSEPTPKRIKDNENSNNSNHASSGILLLSQTLANITPHLSCCGDPSTTNSSTCSTTPITNTSPCSSQDDDHDDNHRVVTTHTKDVIVTPKRQNYLSWDDYFLAVAVLSSKRSKDPYYPRGACLVDSHHRIVGIGYNGFPRGCSDDVLPWAMPHRHQDTNAPVLPRLHTQEPYVCHAINNAILNKCSDGCRMYVMKFPCSDCAKQIIQERIQEVVVLQYHDDDEDEDEDEDANTSSHRHGTDNSDDPEDLDMQASRILLTMAGVSIRYCKPSQPRLVLNFLSALSPTTQDNHSTETKNHHIVTPTSTSLSSSSTISQEDIKLMIDEANYDPTKPVHPSSVKTKRMDYISWEDYFMAMAFLTAQRSKDPNTQVGACIVDSSKRIVGLGYNGFPRGCSDDRLPWARSNAHPLWNKYLYVCHAEVNAILNRGSANVQGSTIYVALFPCHKCAQMIIQIGIREVVYMCDPYHDTEDCRASRILLTMAKVQLRQYIPTMQQLTLDMTWGANQKHS